MDSKYWLRQKPDEPLFPGIEWQKPEQKSLAGKLLIIGGNSLGFSAVAQAYKDAQEAGAGECRVILPDSLKAAVGTQFLDCIIVPSNPSGGMSKEAMPSLKAGAAWCDTILLIGDNGRNSETAIVLETLLASTEKTVLITRDCIDLLKVSFPQLLERENTIFVATLAQLQKLFQSVYYPKIILFSMSLVSIVEALHKFTITYPVGIVVLHQGNLILALNGLVSTCPWEEPMLIWRGSVATKAATYAMQHPGKKFEAITSSFI